MKLIRYQQPTLQSPVSNLSSLFEDALTSLSPLRSFQDPELTRSPRVRYKEFDSKFDFVFEVPGVSREDINIHVENTILTVSSGKNASENNGQEENKAEASEVIRYLSQVRLPRLLDLDAAEAKLENGILTVSFPKAEQAKARQIEIK